MPSGKKTGPGAPGADIQLKIVIAMVVDRLMELIGTDRAPRPVLVGQSRAIGIAVRTVGATVAADIAGNRTAGAREVAAAAARRCTVTLECVAVGIVAVVLGIVLTWRGQGAELEAIPDRDSYQTA